MTFHHTDPHADELALGWGEDTIYCEATCDPQDVLYCGSEDDNYDSPEERKQRYEAAGQRYLDGKVPFIMTALLKGPFESNPPDWENPWRSKQQRTIGTSKRTRTSPGKLARSAKVRRNISIPETVQSPNDSLQCHLPSPESLNQTSELEAHPYLEEDELAKVHEWRDSVESEKEHKDQFWTSIPSGTVSERKRKANGSSWLKLLTKKRRRTDIMESGSVDTPVPSRPQAPTSSMVALNTSFSSVPDHLPSSAIATENYFNASQDNPPVLEDELACNKTAPGQPAACSSSPLSCLQCTPVPVQLPDSSSQGSVEQATPSKLPISRQTSAPQRQVAQTLSPSNNGAAKLDPAFETQEDDSFCFKMRPKSNPVADDTPVKAGTSAVAADEETCSVSCLDQDMHSMVSDLKDGTPVEEQLDVQSPGSAMELNQCAVTSPLSSTCSENFEGFDLSKESPVATTAIARSSPSITETMSDSPHSPMADAAQAIPEEPIEPQQDAELEIIDMDETAGPVSSLTAPESLTASETNSTDESDGEQEKEEIRISRTPTTRNDKTTQSPNMPRESETTPRTPTVPKTNCNSTTPDAEFLLKASVKKRFISQASWKGLAHLASSPSRQTPLKETNSRSPGHLSSPISGREKRSLTGSIHSTPKTTKSRPTSNFSQTSNHNASPTNVNATGQEAHSAPEPCQSVPQPKTQVSVSQQSPWAESKLSQYAITSLSQSSTESPKSDGQEPNVTKATTSPVNQTPWAHEDREMPIKPLASNPTIDTEDQRGSFELNAPACVSELDIQTQDLSAVTTPVTAATSEPQFSLKSFASFRSPSSERLSQRAIWKDMGSRLPSTQGILASATKNPWETKTSGRRVTFAPLPLEDKVQSSIPTTPCPSSTKRRLSSPPPGTESPMSEDAKSPVALDGLAPGPIIRRSDRLLPPESQCTLDSPLPDAMAETFLIADRLRQSASLLDPSKSDGEADDSQDPMDMAADVFRDSDIFRDWDESPILDDAVQQSPYKVQGLRSPW
ncbi:protamine p1 [Fusarium heterosporum]|uniref:Protamine p1 n=1 Tax=Fusarium heterosporum TaxID=42747 RepID=A0A8H5TY95_FUSHE|nr:protamine p1 [Fusarium heterosporum]